MKYVLRCTETYRYVDGVGELSTKIERALVYDSAINGLQNKPGFEIRDYFKERGLSNGTIDKGIPLPEIRERLETLQAKERDLDSRLLSVNKPDSVLAHVERLRQRAQEILDHAELLQYKLVEDTANKSTIERELKLTRAESELARFHLRHKIRPKMCLKSLLAKALGMMIREAKEQTTD